MTEGDDTDVRVMSLDGGDVRLEIGEPTNTVLEMPPDSAREMGRLLLAAADDAVEAVGATVH